MPRGAIEALCNAVGAMAVAAALGAPARALRSVMARLRLASTGIWIPAQSSPPLPPLLPLPAPIRKALARAPRAAPREPKVDISPWDPATPAESIEVGRCRALLLEILRRAIHDWILYRNHSKLEMRQRAESAHTWLFEERPGHPWWLQRVRDGHTITAFLVICEALDLDPDFVRKRARQTTIKQIMTAGRPAERRRSKKEVAYEEHGVDENVSLDALDAPRGTMNSYEAHFAAYTPDYA